MFDIPEYVSCIVDETGQPVHFCANLTEKQIEDILNDHPEWYRDTVRINKVFL